MNQETKPDAPELPPLPEPATHPELPAQEVIEFHKCKHCGYVELGANDGRLAAPPAQAPADAQSTLASLSDTVAAAIRNTCSMPHPNIGLDTDLAPHIWSLSYEANAQKARADADAIDARRYRWLREQKFFLQLSPDECIQYAAGESLDAAIDAAMGTPTEQVDAAMLSSAPKEG